MIIDGFSVYILRCGDGSYYVGHTDSIEKRISEHQQGLGCAYTSERLPIEVVFLQHVGSRAEAINAERQIKGWSRKKKEALINEKWAELSVLAKKKFNRN